jgi:cytochrome c553
VAAPSEAQRTAGATLAAQGANGVAACNGCHGAQGEGIAASGFPRIAGQSVSYLLHELESYAAGGRKHPIMQPIAAAMTPEQRSAAAAYFASLAPAATAAAAAASAPAMAAAPAASARGGGGSGRAQLLAARGDEAAGVQACVNCHGPGGIGAGELYPYLAGQHAAYLSATLQAWRDGSRNNDPSGQMPIIAKALSPEDLTALAHYYAAQPVRSTPVQAERMAAAAFTAEPAVTSGPQAQGVNVAGGTAGAGTEQGAATTGGQQGPGGGGGTGPASTGAPLAAQPPAGQAASSAR